MVPLSKQLFAVLLLHLPLIAELDVCDSIPFEKDVHLPCEQRYSSPCGPRTLFLPRSPGSNTARHIAGWYEYLPGCDDRVWGNLGLTVEYNHSFHGNRLAQYLFGSTCLTFTGSQVPDRKPTDLLADNFGLPTYFKGTVCFKPTIKTVITEILLDIGLDEWLSGLYFKAYFPVVNTRWDLGLHCREKNNIPLTAIPTFDPCYMAKDRIHAAQSIREALAGSFTFGDSKVPIMFGKFTCASQSRTGIADIEVIAGWNPILTCDSHLGGYIITTVPTSNTPEALTIFEPIIGNGDLWELGVGISGHYDLIRCGCQLLTFYIEGHITHQFRNFQVRSYDFKDRGPLSRYLLLKEFNNDLQYRNGLVNGIDYATHATRVGAAYKIDASAKLSYYYGEWGLDLGYNIYARGKETIRIEPDIYPSDFLTRIVGIKGTEGVCARVFDTITDTLTDKTISLNTTQGNATIYHAGTPNNPEQITDLASNEVAIAWNSSLNPNKLIKAITSNPPSKLTLRDLDTLSGAIPKQLSHKVFANLSYTALNLPWEPQFGVGGEVEFDGKRRFISALNQWGVWVKGTWSY